ncbi:hypothetical protein JL721_591 [Aureococcus anophagefferens]|nr:hypothetical protein JL721_591 [Aureococcus anophagefferens]
MCICFLCFPDSPHKNDKRAGRANMFATSMSNAPCANPAIFCASWCCFPCLNYHLRSKAIEDMNNYICCQGYANYCCFKAGSIGDQGNPLCLFLESCCFPGLAVSSTRQFVMDKYDLASDPCDRKIMHCNNIIWTLACICNILAFFIEELRCVAQALDCFADIVFCTTMGCMNAQVDLELKKRMGAVAPGAPICAEAVYELSGGAAAAEPGADAMAERD